jgi:transcriptional regulator GlxA family with amidase domain
MRHPCFFRMAGKVGPMSLLTSPTSAIVVPMKGSTVSLLPAPPPRRVLILGAAPAQSLDLIGPAEIMSQASRLQGAGLYEIELAVVPAEAQPDGPTTSSGVVLAPGRSLAALVADPRPLDTLIIAGGKGARQRAEEPELRSAVSRLAQRARRVASVCTGAFVLAAAGLLDGRRAVTHWRWCETLAELYPFVRVETAPIYVRDGNLWTSAGVTAGMDLALALVEEDHGHAIALAIARELVMFLRRPGGQCQFSVTLAAQTAPGSAQITVMRDLVAWMADNLHRPLTVEDLASRTRFSPRQFARVFARELGVPPGLMVDRLRVEAARRHLEEAQHSLAAIAASCGFGTEETMRRAFLRHLGTPPGAYRERFRRGGEDEVSGMRTLSRVRERAG